MNPAVVDASVILRWAFEDETDREGATAVAQALQDGRLIVTAPPNFLLEVAAALVVALRMERIPRTTVDTVMRALAMVAIDEVQPHRFADAAIDIALKTGARVADAAYLETARRTESLLITADVAQLASATRMGLAAIPLTEVPALDA